MSKYLRKFNSLEDANAQGGGGLESPHVDIIDGCDAVNYIIVETEKFTCSFGEDCKIKDVEPIEPVEPAIKALKFELVGEPLAQDREILGLSKIGTPNGTNFEWSYDGQIWTPFVWEGNVTDCVSFGSVEHPYVYVRGNNPNGIGKSDSDYVYFRSKYDGYFKVSRDVKYLLGENINEIPCDYCFRGLFMYLDPSLSSGITGCKIEDASKLVLSFNTLRKSCYRYMFCYQNYLQYPPMLPATNLAYECYGTMFLSCLNLEEFPELPATALAERCYNSMFRYAYTTQRTKNIDIILPARTSTPQCYRQMFAPLSSSVSTLIDGDKITILLEDLNSSKCIENIFQYCTANATLIVADGMKQAWLDSGVVPTSFTIREVSEPQLHD